MTLLGKGTEKQSMRIARWSCRLMKYNFDMVFTKGSDNVVPDALSRLPVVGDESDFDDDSEVICQVLAQSMTNFVTYDEFKDCCSNDSVYEKLVLYVQNGWPKMTGLDVSLKPYYAVRDEYCVCDNLVLRGDKFVVPNNLRLKLVELSHESHQGMTRTKQRLRELYWWPSMDLDVETLVKNCIVCNHNDKTVKRHFAPMLPVQYPEQPWDKISLDIVGPFERGPPDCRFAITMVDYYSKWPEVCFTRTVNTANVINFVKQVFSREGFVREIVTDNGVQFRSKEFRDFLSDRGIKQTFSSLYYPQSHGAIERFNSVLCNIVQNAINTGKPWKETALQFLCVYRATAHATTGVSPSVLLHGRHMRTKLNLVDKPLPEVNIDKCNVRKTVAARQQSYKKYCDDKRSVKMTNLDVGDWVKVKKPGIVPKGYSKYSEPMQIIRKLSERTFQTEDGKNWNVSRLCKCVQPVASYSGPEESTVDSDNATNDQASNDNVNVPVNVQPRRSQRARKPPAWLADYVQ